MNSAAAISATGALFPNGNSLSRAATNAASWAEAVYDVPPIGQIDDFEIVAGTGNRAVRWLFWYLVFTKRFRAASWVAGIAEVEVLVNGRPTARKAA